MQSLPSILHPVKAVLFDLDGTLVHSSLDFSRIREELGCPEGVDLLHYVDSLEGSRKTQSEQIIHRHELEDACSSRIMAGAIELLQRLDAAGIKTGIITRNSAQATKIKLETCGIALEPVLTREDAAPKPDPQALLHLSRLWSLASEECVYVGDYLYDLQAAENAGMHACLFHPLKGNNVELPSFARLADFICHDFDSFELVLSRYLNQG